MKRTKMAELEHQRLKMQTKCKGCHYYDGWACVYILMQGRRRQCPPGSQCTAFVQATNESAKDRIQKGVMGAAFPSAKRKSPPA